MKKLLVVFILLSLITFFPSSLNMASASTLRGSYLRVIDDKTPFYRSPYDTSPLFYLPYTYYVKVLGTEQGYLHVECYGNQTTPLIDGYVPESLLFDDGLSVVNPYLSLSVWTTTTTPLYSDSSLTNRIQYLFKDRALSYYGQFEHNGRIIYYVGYNDKLGYVEESYLMPFDINNHPNELTFLIPENPPSQENKEENPQSSDMTFTLKIVIIACLIFAGLVALIFILKSSTDKTKKIEYYDQNEFE